jgi:hypothetical protein
MDGNRLHRLSSVALIRSLVVACCLRPIGEGMLPFLLKSSSQNKLRIIVGVLF